MNGRVVETSVIWRKSHRVGLSNVGVDQRRICGRVHCVSQAKETKHQSAVEGAEKLYGNETGCNVVEEQRGENTGQGKDDAVAWALWTWLEPGASEEEGPRYAQRRDKLWMLRVASAPRLADICTAR